MNLEYTFGGDEYVHVTTHYLSASILEMLVQNMPASRKLMIHASVIEDGLENPYADVEIEKLEVHSGGSELC